jgi:hypothetical protein
MPDVTAIQTICEAINGRRLLSLVVIADGAERIVEPHSFGVGLDRAPVLWAWCVSSTESKSCQPGTWLLCRLDQMRDVHALAETFPGSRRGYKRANAQIRQVICQL